jgi:glycosyltransferase involved in cell wall biosynthesis
MKILICINTLSSINQLVYSNHLEFFTQLGRDYPKGQVALFTPRRFSIDTARNMAAKLAVEADYDYVLFIDDDVLLTPDGLKKLIDRGKDIIAGHTIIRGHPFKDMMFKFTPGGALGIYDNWKGNEDETGLLPVDAVGCSFTLIKVKVFKKLEPPYFVTGVQNTEDVYFCLKAREKGVECFVDTSVPTGHLLDPMILTPENQSAMKQFFEERDPNLLPAKVDRFFDYFEKNGVIPVEEEEEGK